MIRFKCPKCQKVLAVDDAKAGSVGVCPGCTARFRIPARPAPPPVVEAEERVQERPLARKLVADEEAEVRPGRRIRTPDEEEDSGADEAVTAKPRRKARPADEAEEVQEESGPARRRPRDEDEEQAEEERPRRKKKRRRRRRERESGGELIPGVENFLTLLIGLVILGFGFFGLALAVPALGIIPMVVGYIITFVAWLWVLGMAYEENPVWGVMIFFFYIPWWVYACANFDRTYRPLLLKAVGIFFVFVGIFAGYLGADSAGGFGGDGFDGGDGGGGFDDE